MRGYIDKKVCKLLQRDQRIPTSMVVSPSIISLKYLQLKGISEERSSMWSYPVLRQHCGSKPSTSCVKQRLRGGKATRSAAHQRETSKWPSHACDCHIWKPDLSVTPFNSRLGYSGCLQEQSWSHAHWRCVGFSKIHIHLLCSQNEPVSFPN